jgi:hypothetical protein
MSARSKRKRRREHAKKVGHPRGRGQRWFLIAGPGMSSEEIAFNLFACLPERARQSLAGYPAKSWAE